MRMIVGKNSPDVSIFLRQPASNAVLLPSVLSVRPLHSQVDSGEHPPGDWRSRMPAGR